jgi:lipoprotein-anchoring transpeptidase ErfK/SrfK
VQALQLRLRQLHYLLPHGGGSYGPETRDAVLAFQKVNGLARTGFVSRSVWTRLTRAGVPQPRYLVGTHIEVDKRRQVLLDVVRGRVVRVVHVSTGATGNTPVGRWRIYAKTPGFNAHLMYYSMFFLRGFAIHGYPVVPAFPASHGCVRTPLWAAPLLYTTHADGTPVYVY